ncbi:MAG TPA: hypothetical protein VGL94_00285 [Ktedonobacteraceae bacterium]
MAALAQHWHEQIAVLWETTARKMGNVARTPATKLRGCVVVGGVVSDAASTMSAAWGNVLQGPACSVVAARITANLM